MTEYHATPYTEDWSSGTINSDRWPRADNGYLSGSSHPLPAVVDGRLALDLRSETAGPFARSSFVYSHGLGVVAAFKFYRFLTVGDGISFRLETNVSGGSFYLRIFNYDGHAGIDEPTGVVGQFRQVSLDIFGTDTGLDYPNQFRVQLIGYDSSVDTTPTVFDDSVTTGPYPYDPTAHRYLRLRFGASGTDSFGGVLSTNAVVLEGSPDGGTWSELWRSTTLDFFIDRAIVALTAADNVDSLTTVDDVQINHSPTFGDDGGGDSLIDYGPEVDLFDPDFIMPPSDFVPDPIPSGQGESSILDLVRLFSKSVKRPVRLTGPATIAMVGPNFPMPAGMLQADADAMYHATDIQRQAGEKELSFRAGALVVNASADIKSNDVRVLMAGWRIPDRLPVYGLDPSLVQRVSMTFTPTAFSASVEFYVPPSQLAPA